MQKDFEARIVQYKVKFECTKCHNNFTYWVSDPQVEAKCPNCKASNKVCRENIRRIQVSYKAIVEGWETLLHFHVDHDKHQLLPHEMGAAFGQFPSKYSEIQAFNRTGEELENNPYWEGYEYVEDYRNVRGL